MAALFPRWSNSLFPWTVALIGFGSVAALASAWAFVRGPLNTGVGAAQLQPVAFDHRHHVLDVGIDCRYCHYTVESGANAGVPATQVCMNCHAQVWPAATETDEVRASYFDDRPIVWERVTALPDHVYFNHSIHVGRGVGCVTCHGRVDLMTRVSKAEPLNMDWCINCHRAPESRLRPLSEITNMAWQSDDPELGRRLRDAADIDPPTHCSGCHR
jgi:hypothetical protein